MADAPGLWLGLYLLMILQGGNCDYGLQMADCGSAKHAISPSESLLFS
jgi:hypothetical protein